MSGEGACRQAGGEEAAGQGEPRLFAPSPSATLLSFKKKAAKKKGII